MVLWIVGISWAALSALVLVIGLTTERSPPATRFEGMGTAAILIVVAGLLFCLPAYLYQGQEVKNGRELLIHGKPIDGRVVDFYMSRSAPMLRVDFPANGEVRELRFRTPLTESEATALVGRDVIVLRGARSRDDFGLLLVGAGVVTLR